MRKIIVGIAGVTLVAGGLAVVAPIAFAQTPAQVQASDAPERIPSDDLPSPLGDKQRALTQEAVSGVLNGSLHTEQRGGSTVVKVGASATANGRGGVVRKLFNHKDQYVELSRERTDKIFVILVQFGDQVHPSYPSNTDTDPATPGPVRFDGPLKNAIPQPDRALDNSTVWQADYNRQHYQDLYFGNGESLKKYYEAQSSGRYSVDGMVTDWVKVNYNEARYGRSNGFPCASQVCSNTWFLIRDAANQWVADQLAAGRTPAQVQADMQAFDQYDRYDFDGDGNFNEADGYIDHFQIVHAGGDQADGDPVYGEDAIWSHRWYVNQIFDGTVGPGQNPIGGYQIGSTGIWIGDYTIQPENGGRSVFYHEYGHDLGLPDDYNILSGGDNNNEHWTLMAQSRLGAKTDGGIGERGGDLAAWNKLQLGWLNYQSVTAGQTRLVNLGPEEYNSDKKQAIVVTLPKKTVTTDLGAPATGTKQWYSGDGNDLDNSMAKSGIAIPAGTTTLSLKARWDIEQCGPDACDYAFVEVNDGTGYAAIPGSITVAAEGNGIDGTQATYTPATFDLSAFAGKTISLRFRYVTDGAVAGNDDAVPNGIFIDDVAVTNGATTILSDGAETSPNGWTLAGFNSVGPSTSQQFDNFYIAGHRSYVSYDQYLKTGPYYFGYQNTRPDFVDHYAYQTGLLISYWDTSYGDNDTFAHPGNGRNLYVDAHPKPLARSDGSLWRSRVQVYDAPFGLSRTDKVTLHQNSAVETIQGRAGQPLFDDQGTYWYPELPNHGVKLPGVGVKIRVLLTVGTSMLVLVS